VPGRQFEVDFRPLAFTRFILDTQVRKRDFAFDNDQAIRLGDFL
jgi:hypothetical protein